MTLTLELKPEEEARLRKRASDKGCDVTDYVKRLIERDLLADQPFDTILSRSVRVFKIAA